MSYLCLVLFLVTPPPATYTAVDGPMGGGGGGWDLNGVAILPLIRALSLPAP